MFTAAPASKLGSLSKDDGYGNENVIPKYNLALLQVFRNYSVLFTFNNTGELSCNWMGTNGFKVKTKNDCFIVICSRCLQYLKYGDFTLLLCGVRQRNARKFVLHVQHEYFPFLTNNIIALWRCRSRSRRLKEFKKRRRLRLYHRQKAVILLVKRTKMLVLHVRHAFLNISLPYSSKLQREMTKFKVLTTTWTNYSFFQSHSLLQIRPYQSNYRTLRPYCII